MPLSADDFLKTVMRSGLLTKPELEGALATVPAAQLQDAQALADHLVALGKLTSFQATKLLQGASVGLKLGPYHILTPIGKGGMGMVYLGVDTRTSQHVAVKVLSPQRKREGERHIQRFYREMEIAKNLLHPNLVLAHDIGEERGVHYLVMEYIPGHTVHRLVTWQGPFPVPRAAAVFSEVAAALGYAHSQGLIHRDLKPANIILTPNDHAKVLDLGLAIMQGESLEDTDVLGGKGHVVGSFDYISPEQTRDPGRVDGRADIYSLGCALYFTMTGRPPFPLGTAKEKIQAQRHLFPDPVQQLNPTVPADFAALIQQMMAKNPDQRPATMAQVRAALSPWASGAGDKPMDQESDPTFQEAVTQLQNAPLPAEADELLIVPEEGPTRSLDIAIHERSFKLLVVGVAAIWGLVLLLLILIFTLG
jgi:serine/threonine protein kinase